MHEVVDIFLRHDGYFVMDGMRSPFLLELAFWAVVLPIATLLFRFPAPFAAVERALGRLSRRRVTSVVVVGLAALAIRAALLSFIPIPEPIVHDEFSYLLQSDTFASGRLTNPPHTLWIHFESFHINVLPTYQSMYPPAQAAFLAVAQLVTGQPWWGVWLSVGLLCAAVCWMLQAWMPPPWPLIGGMFCVLRFAVFSYWMNSYWGGAVAAIAGALVLGAAGRLRRQVTLGNSLLLALGLGILACSRPYEGLVLSIPVLIALLVWVRQRGWVVVAKRLVIPAAVVLSCVVAFMLFYNWRGTGHPLVMPYVVNEARYHITRTFIWQTRRPIPNYDHSVFRKFYVYWELPDYVRLHTDSDGIVWVIGGKLAAYYSFFFWPVLFLVIPSVWVALKSQRVRLLAVAAVAVVLASLLIMWPPQAHYLAPVTAAFVAISLYGLRLLRTWRPRRVQVGIALSRAVMLVVAGWMLFCGACTVLNPYKADEKEPFIPQELDRARIDHALHELPGKQLIFVKTRRDHDGGEDWVYNRADIDHAKIVWVRDMGPDGNAPVLKYYRDRHAWIVDQDDGIRRLSDYESRPGLAWSSLALKLVHQSAN